MTENEIELKGGMYSCKKCLSYNVMEKVWISMNEDDNVKLQSIEYINGTEYYCNKCDEIIDSVNSYI